MIASNLRNTLTAVAATGLVLVGTAAIEATLNPAHASTTQTFRTSLERSIDAEFTLPEGRNQRGVATVAVRIDRNGSVQSVGLVQSAGSEAFDREALRTARAVSYPKGADRNVVMVLGFGRAVTAADRAKGIALARGYVSDSRKLLASGTRGQPGG